MSKTTIKFYFMFGLVVLVALLTPHFVHGHILLPEQYAQSAVLFLDILVAYIFYVIYKKDIAKINSDKKKVENNLIDSYNYIGKVNREIDLFDKFINYLSDIYPQDKNEKKHFFKTLLNNLIVSVCQTNKGFLRFIDTQNQRTVQEFYYHSDGDQFVVKLSNRELIDEDVKIIENDDIVILASDYQNSRIKSVLCCPASPGKKIDFKLAKSLINQIHLLFLLVYFK